MPSAHWRNQQTVIGRCKFFLTRLGGAAILNHMVYYSAAQLDATFGALSDATRRAILARLAGGDSSVSELAEPFRMSLPAVSKHLRVLEQARLLRREKNGRVHRCRLLPAPLKSAQAWIAFYRQFWNQQLDTLENFLVPLPPTDKKENSACHPQKQPHNSRSKSSARSPRLRSKSSMRGRNRNR